MSEIAGPRVNEIETLTLQWLALSLTEGLGAGKARRLVEFFGSIEAVFHASLTELEASGIRAVSAQALGTGSAMELAKDELAKAMAANVTVVAFSSPEYPPHLKQIYDPPLILYVRGATEHSPSLESPWLEPGIRRPTDREWPSGLPAI